MTERLFSGNDFTHFCMPQLLMSTHILMVVGALTGVCYRSLIAFLFAVGNEIIRYLRRSLVASTVRIVAVEGS